MGTALFNVSGLKIIGTLLALLKRVKNHTTLEGFAAPSKLVASSLI